MVVSLAMGGVSGRRDDDFQVLGRDDQRIGAGDVQLVEQGGDVGFEAGAGGDVQRREGLR
ncbi:hypothetical protein ACCUM_1313 [Candidatus Accumulibacter phosphatis]|uniref:Uncharacterized protein n=1 Tax=Candidatus Accumulibacter phosphatis TaxID=327160 RepID=A0A5S4EGK9_9PROT|nr:hypothetical protein ACCUM_1313 [Candidatus Accumulibacter phosphatis]